MTTFKTSETRRLKLAQFVVMKGRLGMFNYNGIV